jgi:hypothetical protein
LSNAETHLHAALKVGFAPLNAPDALFDPPGYAAAFPNCDRNLADVNADGVVDFFDIDPFLTCLFSACP